MTKLDVSVITELLQKRNPLVYILWNGAECMYVGMSGVGGIRVLDSIIEKGGIDLSHAEIRTCATKEEARTLEIKLIKEFRPPLNSKGTTNGKSGHKVSRAHVIISLKADPENIAKWKVEAGQMRVSLSEWIRRNCNGPSNHDSDVRRVPENPLAPREGTPAPRRRARSADARASASDGTSKKCPEVVGPGLFCPSCGKHH